MNKFNYSIKTHFIPSNKNYHSCCNPNLVYQTCSSDWHFRLLLVHCKSYSQLNNKNPLLAQMTQLGVLVTYNKKKYFRSYLTYASIWLLFHPYMYFKIHVECIPKSRNIKFIIDSSIIKAY